jgi:hypothetical protein
LSWARSLWQILFGDHLARENIDIHTSAAQDFDAMVSVNHRTIQTHVEAAYVARPQRLDQLFREDLSNLSSFPLIN